MKKSHILGLIVIAIAIAIIVSTTGNASSYVDFATAKSMAKNGNDRKIHVVGTLMKGAENQILGLEESPDKLSFKFIMLDQNNAEQMILHANPIPQDFDKSEQVVVVGSFKNDVFIAEKILMKCPSKYQESEIKV